MRSREFTFYFILFFVKCLLMFVAWPHVLSILAFHWYDYKNWLDLLKMEARIYAFFDIDLELFNV